MGLDFVEIVMEVEQQLAIEFEDDDFQNIVTVGDFYDLTISKIDFQNVESGIRHTVFQKFRDMSLQECNIAKNDISLNTPLEALFKNPIDENTWQNYSAMMNYKLPPLVCSSRARVFCEYSSVTGLGLIILSWITLILSFYQWAGLMLLVCLLLFVINKYFIKHVYLPSETVGELIQAIIKNNSSLLVSDNKLKPDDVWQILQNIFVDQQGIPIEKITKDAKIVDELGID